MTDAQTIIGIATILLSLFATAFYSGRKLGETSEKVNNVRVITEQQEQEIKALKQTVNSIMESTTKLQIALAVLTENVVRVTAQIEILARKVNNNE